MNILPKKSWHVRTKKNIERVRQDEAKAEELARLEEQRVLVAEQEARIDYLRNRLGLEPSSKSDPSILNSASKQESSLKGSDGHINLFDSAKDHQTSTNKEHDYEKNREEILWQSKVGILNKLGGLSTNVDKPWYVQDHEKRMGLNPVTSDGSKISGQYKPSLAYKSKTIQSVHDPLIIMQTAQRIIAENKSQAIEDLDKSPNKLKDSEIAKTTYIDLTSALLLADSSKHKERRKHKREKKIDKEKDRTKASRSDKHRSHRKSSHKKSKHSKHKKRRKRSP